MKFKPGDKVIAKKPLINKTGPYWVDNMDKYDGEILIIRKINYTFGNDRISYNCYPKEDPYDTWNYQEDWLTLHNPPKFKVGDKVRVWKSKKEPFDCWINDMDRFDGKVLTVVQIRYCDTYLCYGGDDIDNWKENYRNWYFYEGYHLAHTACPSLDIVWEEK